MSVQRDCLAHFLVTEFQQELQGMGDSGDADGHTSWLDPNLRSDGRQLAQSLAAAYRQPGEHFSTM